MSLQPYGADDPGSIPDPENNGASAPESDGWLTVWSQYAAVLAEWVWTRLVNRTDAWGGYWWDGDHAEMTTNKAADKGPLTRAIIESHFLARRTADIIGLHTTFRDEEGRCWSRWLVIDIDLHKGKGDPAANLRFALALYAAAVALGFRPLLIDSNGAGSYHLVVIFERPVLTSRMYAFSQWLVRDWQAHGLEKVPETFPKQPSINEDAPGNFGNWWRCIGHHHTRNHHAKVWGASAWLEDEAGIVYVLATEGSPESLIPAEALEPAAAFDLGAEIKRRQAREAAVRLTNKSSRPASGDGPNVADDLASKIDWAGLLIPAGWHLDLVLPDGERRWTRPGKDGGTSGTTDHAGRPVFKVFTDGAPPFVKDKAYSKFQVYALLCHNGDESAAGRALFAMGYGKRRMSAAVNR
jgi:hypothetical protein